MTWQPLHLKEHIVIIRDTCKDAWRDYIENAEEIPAAPWLIEQARQLF